MITRETPIVPVHVRTPVDQDIVALVFVLLPGVHVDPLHQVVLLPARSCVPVAVVPRVSIVNVGRGRNVELLQLDHRFLQVLAARLATGPLHSRANKFQHHQSETNQIHSPRDIHLESINVSRAVAIYVKGTNSENCTSKSTSGSLEV